GYGPSIETSWRCSWRPWRVRLRLRSWWCSVVSGVAGPLEAFGGDEGAERLAADDATDVAGREHIKDDDRQIVLLAKRDRGAVHHVEPAGQYLEVGEAEIGRASCRERVESAEGGGA